MLFDLNFSEIVNLIYKVSFSYLLFYYFMLFCLASVIKIIMNVHMDVLKAELGIFKIDENLVPPLLLIGWFGLIVHAVTELNIFNNKPLIALWSASFFIICLIFLRSIQTRIQKMAIFSHFNRRAVDENYKKVRSQDYIRYTEEKYKFIIISILLMSFCILFSVIKFDLLAVLSLCSIMISYFYYCVYPKIEEVIKNLKRSSW